jgi:hypothetical protein
LYTYDGNGKDKVVTLRQEGYKDDIVRAVLILNLGTAMTSGQIHARGALSPGKEPIE